MKLYLRMTGVNQVSGSHPGAQNIGGRVLGCHNNRFYTSIWGVGSRMIDTLQWKQNTTKIDSFF